MAGSKAVTFFRAPGEFRTWLTRNHATAQELVVGFYKKDSGKPSITWPESVDEALCVGWIDGIRHGLDAVSYTIRFTPRRPGSMWSAVNVARARALIKAGRMRAAGRKAFEARKENKVGIYGYEQRSVELPEPYGGLLRANAEAWRFFQAQSPWYRKTAMWWVVSAKREETRHKRLGVIIAYSAVARTIPGLTRAKPTLA